MYIIHAVAKGLKWSQGQFLALPHLPNNCPPTIPPPDPGPNLTLTLNPNLAWVGDCRGQLSRGWGELS